MPERLYLRPKRGLVIPDILAGDYLPAEGRWVQANAYWYRRIADSSVVNETEKMTKQEEAATKKTPAVAAEVKKEG